jgi:hypothetical protein
MTKNTCCLKEEIKINFNSIHAANIESNHMEKEGTEVWIY